jgi:PAS domain S-box-containing protein
MTRHHPPNWLRDRLATNNGVALVAGLLTAVVGALVLLGWSFDIDWLKSVTFISQSSMKANTALCFLLIGTTLILAAKQPLSQLTTRIPSNYAKWISKVCAIAVFCVGTLTLSQYLWGWNLGIDELLFADAPISHKTSHPGRMGINTAINFILIGIALGSIAQPLSSNESWKFDRSAILAQTLSLIAESIAMQAIVGYVYGVSEFYHFNEYTTSMAPHTAVTFAVLCLGTLALRSDRGLMALVTSRSSGGIAARLLIPGAIAIPLILGWLILQGQRANWYNPAFSLILFAVALVIVLLGLIAWSVIELDKIDLDRIRSSERMRSSEERLQLALRGAGQGIWDWDLKSQVLIWDDRCKEIFGLPPDFPVTYEWFGDALHPDDRQRVFEAVAIAQSGGTEFNEEYRTFHLDGTLAWILARGQVYYDEAGKPNRMSGTVMDISDRKRVQLSDRFLTQLDLRLRQHSNAEAMAWDVVSSLGEYLKVDRCLWHEIDWENGSTTVERSWQRPDMLDITGTYTLNEFFTPNQLNHFAAGQTLIVPDVTTHLSTAAYAQNYLPLGAAAFISVPCLHIGRWVGVLAVNARTPRNWREDEVMLLQETVARLWTLIEQTRAVEALHASEERLRLALMAANQGLYDLNVQTGEAIVSPEYAQMLGYDPQTFQETNAQWQARLHPDDRELVNRIFTEYINGDRGDYKVEFRQQTQSGDWKWILSIGKIVAWDAEGKPLRMLGTHTDIGDRKHAEEALQASEERLSLAVEGSNMATWDMDLQSGAIIWSARHFQLLGYEPTPNTEVTLDLWRSRVYPDDLDEVMATVKQARLTRSPYSVEYRIVKADTGEVRWINAFGRFIYNEAGEAARFVGIFFDDTERKQLEAERAELLVQTEFAREQAETANRLKDEFLAALSHELRTPLNPILGWTKLLQQGRLNPVKTSEALLTIERNAKQQLSLVEDLLDVSSIIQGKFNLTVQLVDLSLILSAAIDTVAFATQTKSITLDFQIIDLAEVMGDENRLQQVFWNLLSNAIKFTPEGGRVDVEHSVVTSQDGQPYAQVKIKDTGMGIASDFLPHVFDRFRQEDGSSTRRHGGLGLGLAIVKSLVELHGGTILVESLGVGKGATFTVQLPLPKNER